MIGFVFKREENIMGKGESAGYQHFSFSNNLFNVALLKVLKTLDGVVKGCTSNMSQCV